MRILRVGFLKNIFPGTPSGPGAGVDNLLLGDGASNLLLGDGTSVFLLV